MTAPTGKHLTLDEVRNMLEMRNHHKFTIEEIAEKLDRPAGTIKKWLSPSARQRGSRMIKKLDEANRLLYRRMTMVEYLAFDYQALHLESITDTVGGGTLQPVSTAWGLLNDLDFDPEVKMWNYVTGQHEIEIIQTQER